MAFHTLKPRWKLTYLIWLIKLRLRHKITLVIHYKRAFNSLVKHSLILNLSRVWWDNLWFASTRLLSSLLMGLEKHIFMTPALSTKIPPQCWTLKMRINVLRWFLILNLLKIWVCVSKLLEVLLEHLHKVKGKTKKIYNKLKI